MSLRSSGVLKSTNSGRSWSVYIYIVNIIHSPQFLGNVAPDDYMIPTMTPNNPKADPKISTTRIFTNVSGV